MIRSRRSVSLDATLLRNFAIALFIGALVGIEREKKKLEEKDSGTGGLRTFILFAEAGAVGAWLSIVTQTPMLFVGIGALTTAVIIAGYWLHVRAKPEAYGLTTEVAAVVVYLLGGAVLFGYAEVAVALAIVTSAVLAFKDPLHGAVGKLGRDDLYAGLKLLLATFIVLPLLPDEAIDPWGALNPYKLWWLVILISSLSLVGYIAVRWLGHERGTSLTGLFGGLASSTAVTLSFARRSKEAPALASALATGVLLAWAVSFGRVLVEVAVVHSALLPRVAVPVATMGVLTMMVAVLLYRASARAGKSADAKAQDVPLKNPFSLTSAIKFGAFFAVILLLVKLAESHASDQGLYLVALLAGASDVDAITLSMANYAKYGGDANIAVNSITLAAIANTVAKCGLIAALATPALKGRMAAATALIVAGGGIALAAV